MKSIWTKTTTLSKRAPLTEDLSVEAVVIGGGLAGLLTAFFLQRQGIDTVVLEASRIGSGQTRNTTAKITSQHNLIYDKLIREFGEDKARQYAQANQQAIEKYQSLIEEKKIDCEFIRLPSYLYTTAEGDSLEKEAQAAQRLGIEAELTTSTSLPFPVKNALRFDNQAQFHPLKFLQAMAEELKIYEDTRVKAVDGNKLVTEGGIVTAKHVVFATHYPFVNVPGYYFMRMHQERSYVVALEHAAALDGMYLGIDEDGLSFRNSGDLLLLGGGKHRTGENTEGGKYQLLRRAAAGYWPECQETAYWSAQDCMTIDGIPYIGKFSDDTPDWYVATGFGKWGMTSSMVSALMLSDLIAGKESPYEEIFSPYRFDLSASAKTMLKDGLESAKGLARGLLDAPRCPHLGCHLEWNADESSWDCPCHGSRFDHHGKLLDNPAQEDLPHA